MQPGALLGLTSALAFGLCDFAAGLASRRVSFWWVTLISLLASASGAWVVVAVVHHPVGATAVLWGLVAGIGAAVGATALYRGYGTGTWPSPAHSPRSERQRCLLSWARSWVIDSRHSGSWARLGVAGLLVVLGSQQGEQQRPSQQLRSRLMSS